MASLTDSSVALGPRSRGIGASERMFEEPPGVAGSISADFGDERVHALREQGAGRFGIHGDSPESRLA